MTHLLWHYLSRSAKRYPDRQAVADQNGVLTYAELDDQSNRFARLLRERGVCQGDRVGIYMPKSTRSVVAMHGCLKAGAAYVPIDPNAPVQRASFILEDCAVRGVVTTYRNVSRLEEAGFATRSLAAIAVVDEEAGAEPPHAGVFTWSDLGGVSGDPGAEVAAVESDPAYLLYTSGSTGHPKGVILSHRHALTFVDWATTTFGINADDRLSNHAPLHFDLSVLDIYAALSQGACVVMVPDRVAAFPVELSEWIEREGISVWYSVPSALTRLLLRGEMERFDYRSLRTILFAGEVFPMKYLRQLMERLAHVDFYNLYGPTETNVCTYYHVPGPPGAEAEEIPIGKACANTEVFAVKEDGSVAGPGEMGELLVRGPLVMLGYWGLDERTRKSLIKDPRNSAYNDPAYRTGDIVRLADDGQYYYVGRNDHMVKSRGYRIELGEIEHVMYEHEGVKEAAVVAMPDPEIGARLHCVYSSHAPDAATEANLRSFCAKRLPKYMVPETFVRRVELPKTSTGKVDRVALSGELA